MSDMPKIASLASILLCLGCAPAETATDAEADAPADSGRVVSDASAPDAGDASDAGPPDAGPPPAALVVDADFEDGALGDPCGGADGFDEPFSLSVRDDTHVFEGETACRLGVNEGSLGFGQLGGIINRRLGELSRGDELWLRISLYVPSDYVFTSGRSKFLRLRTYAADDGPSRGYLDWYLAPNHDRPHAWIYEGSHMWRSYGSPEDNIQRDTWETYEIYYFLDDTPVDEGGEARVRLWKDGVLLGEITDQRTLVEATDVARNLLIFTYYDNDGAPRSQNLWIDRLQVAIEEPPGRDADGNPYLGL